SQRACIVAQSGCVDSSVCGPARAVDEHGQTCCGIVENVQESKSGGSGTEIGDAGGDTTIGVTIDPEITLHICICALEHSIACGCERGQGQIGIDLDLIAAIQGDSRVVIFQTNGATGVADRIRDRNGCQV